MKSAMLTVATLLWAACAAAAPGDATITFTVPINVQKLDPSVKKVGSYCEVKDANGTLLATAFGEINAPVSGNAISGNSVSQMVVPAAKVTSAKTWNCSLLLDAGSICITNASGSNYLPWCMFDASSKTTVNGSF